MTNRKNVFFLLLLFVQFIIACTPPAANMEGGQWIVFTAENARKEQIGGWLFTGEIEYWSPTEADVRAVEEGVGVFLQENAAMFYTNVPVWERLDEYNRQYVGMIVEGRKVLYANFFCNREDATWRKEFVLVLDGGSCYFQFQFDSATGEFFDLRVNGEA